MTNSSPSVSPFFRGLLIVLFTIPLVLAFLFVEKQWYPATLIIDWLADAEGFFSYKMAVILCWGAMMLAVLLLVALAVLVKKATGSRGTK